MSLLLPVINRIHRFLRDDESGASLVEYALLIALIAIVCIAAVTLLGDTVKEPYSEVSSAL